MVHDDKASCSGTRQQNDVDWLLAKKKAMHLFGMPIILAMLLILQKMDVKIFTKRQTKDWGFWKTPW
jgi:hypothetical protein